MNVAITPNAIYYVREGVLFQDNTPGRHGAIEFRPEPPLRDGDPVVCVAAVASEIEGAMRHEARRHKDNVIISTERGQVFEYSSVKGAWRVARG